MATITVLGGTGYAGGASSLLTEVGGPTLWEVSRNHLPAEVKPEIEAGTNV